MIQDEIDDAKSKSLDVHGDENFSWKFINIMAKGRHDNLASKACNMLNLMTEGSDPTVISRLESAVDQSTIMRFSLLQREVIVRLQKQAKVEQRPLTTNELVQAHRAHYVMADACNVLLKIFGTDGQDKWMDEENDEMEERYEVEQENSRQQLISVGGTIRSNKSTKKNQELDSDESTTHDLIGTVELQFKKDIIPVKFPIPLAIRYLTKDTKTTFLNRTRLFATEKRINEMNNEMDVFLSEMDLVRAYVEQYQLFRLMHSNFAVFKAIMFATVVLLNLNIVMSPKALQSPVGAFAKVDTLSNAEVTSLIITLSLGTFNFFGYFASMFYLSIVTIPVLISEHRIKWRRSLDEYNKNPVKPPHFFKNPSAFNALSFAIFLNFTFILIHWTNFPNHRNRRLYYL